MDEVRRRLGLGREVVGVQLELATGQRGAEGALIFVEQSLEDPEPETIVVTGVRARRGRADGADSPFRVRHPGVRPQEPLGKAGALEVEASGLARQGDDERQLPAVGQSVGEGVRPAAHPVGPAIAEDRVAPVERGLELGNERSREHGVDFRVAQFQEPGLDPPLQDQAGEARDVERVGHEAGALEPTGVVQIGRALVVHDLGHDHVELGQGVEGEPADVHVRQDIVPVELGVRVVSFAVFAGDLLEPGRDA